MKNRLKDAVHVTTNVIAFAGLGWILLRGIVSFAQKMESERREQVRTIETIADTDRDGILQDAEVRAVYERVKAPYEEGRTIGYLSYSETNRYLSEINNQK